MSVVKLAIPQSYRVAYSANQDQPYSIDTVDIPFVDSRLIHDQMYSAVKQTAFENYTATMILVGIQWWVSLIHGHIHGHSNNPVMYRNGREATPHFLDLPIYPDSAMPAGCRVICSPRDEERIFLTTCTRGHEDCLKHPEIGRECQKQWLRSLTES